jgi:pimeloyl-ACP methyl ester carboxylesterase
MINERELITRVEAADTKELAEILERRSPAEEEVLRTHLGEPRFNRMCKLVLQSALTRASRTTQGNVVVLHGIMGSELTYYETDAHPDTIWLKIFRLIAGQFERLRVDDEGQSISRIQATGILKRYYGELLLSLMQSWNAHAFWFDWRLDINSAADQLALRLQEWFGDHEPVHLVAHSMGGLVARAFIKRHTERWESMWDSQDNGRRGGRLVMLGTPNHGSFAIPHLLLGLNDTLHKLALADLHHNLQDLFDIIKTFVGSYQMLPSPLVPGMQDMQRLYEVSTYAPLDPLPSRFAVAREFHTGLQMVIDPDRMLYVAGYNQPTYSGIRDWNQLRSTDGYEVTKRGDGTVPHTLGLLQAADGRPVPTYYIDEEHGALPGNQCVMAAIDDLLRTGTTSRLTQQIPAELRGEEDETTKQAARAELLVKQEMDEAQLKALIMPLQAVGTARGDSVEEPPVVNESERQSEDILTRGFISAPTDTGGTSVGSTTHLGQTDTASVPKISIRLLKAEIQDVGQPGTSAWPSPDAEMPHEIPVDAIAVGHYIGVKPVAAEKALDQAISDKLRGHVGATNIALGEADLLLTLFTERGIIRGELGQPFFLDDPRTRDDDNNPGPDRLIAIAGMGYAGRFGTPELTVLARELCWSLGRLGKRHLATVLIGSGNGNLSTRDAVSAWLEGVKRAIGSSAEDARRHLEVITFIERQPGKLLRIWKALEAALPDQPPTEVELIRLTPQQIEQLKAEAVKEAAEENKRRLEAKGEAAEDKLTSDIPTRLTVEQDGDVYRFGAMTETASAPQRDIALDPDLVNEANTELAAQREKGQQGESGEFLERLLFPADLQQLLSSNAPLVLTCDSTVARIHWEMVVQPDPIAMAGPPSQESRRFLGLHRGFTRQLRTIFAPPPEPPPPPNRVLRVLIVGDPAADKPLPGAQQEAMLVRDLFKKFQQLVEQAQDKKVAGVEIVALLGPSQATRTRVMQELILKSYDVLHYAGHCMYDQKKPSASGWIFTGGKRLSANELSRIDRIPKFVFSNACESGITPDRSEQRSPELAPSFAETFFARGVQNFVCTAWPVNDQAALDFAERFYTGLLGLDGKDAEPMHVAMREARLTIHDKSYGVRTWGAYQHYGNPYFRLCR